MQIDDASKMIKHSKLWGWKGFFSNFFSPYQMYNIPFHNWNDHNIDS
jgi:hypothetical protein